MSLRRSHWLQVLHQVGHLSDSTALTHRLIWQLIGRQGRAHRAKRKKHENILHKLDAADGRGNAWQRSDLTLVRASATAHRYC